MAIPYVTIVSNYWTIGSRNLSLKSVVPKEINEHLRLYSKEPWEVQFVEECGVCGSRTDEFGLCGCDTGGGD
jgi:hypothetical protein